jgi:hypothetical protein
LKHCEAVGSWENDIEEDEVGFTLPKHIETLLSITGLENVIDWFENHLEGGTDSRIVIDQQNPFSNDQTFHKRSLRSNLDGRED